MAEGYEVMNEAIAAWERGALRDWLAAGLPLDSARPEAFVDPLEARLDAFTEQTTRFALEQHTPSEAEQVDLLYTIGWGEWRSLNTFALQLARTDQTQPEHRELRQQLVKQMDDELRHFRLCDRALRQLGVTTPILETDPEDKAASLMASFAWFDENVTDPLLGTGPMQFMDERAPLVFETVVSRSEWAIEPLRETLTTIVPDEEFHVSIGRQGMLTLAARGRDARNAALDAITAMMERFTLPKLTYGRIGKAQH